MEKFTIELTREQINFIKKSMNSHIEHLIKKAADTTFSIYTHDYNLCELEEGLKQRRGIESSLPELSDDGKGVF